MSTMMYDKIQKMTVALLLAFVLLTCQCLPALASSVDSVQVRSAALASGTITKNGMVRVYLSSLGNPTSLDLTVKGNYSLSHSGEFIASGSNLRVGFSPSTGNITLTYHGQTIHMGKSFSLRRHSASGSNGILIAQSRDSQNPYPGDLSFEAVANGGSYTLYTIAHIYIENYLYGVLPYEMGNSSGLEALKAQAVAARTYTVRMMESRASGRYDVKDTTSDQVYRGTPSGNANCVAAVDATKGIVLMYGSDYITTYYSSSNGGQTETARTGTAYAYMKVKDDPFDYANPDSTVKKKTIYADLTNTANPSALIALLKNKAISSLQRSGYPADSGNTNLIALKNAAPHTPMYASPSRVYTKMDFTFSLSTVNAAGQRVNITLTETCGIFSELESLLGMSIQSMQNELWSVEKGNGTFVLQARRFGHGMGMSQRGAMYMAKQGYSYDQILGFYYDGCKRVSHSFTNSILNASSSDQQITVEPPVDLEGEGNLWSNAVVATESGSLNLRSEPNANSSVLTTIPKGAAVIVLNTGDAWTSVRYGGYDGYVMTRYLAFSQDSPAEKPSQPEPESSLTATVVTPSGTLNLRMLPHTGSRILARIPPYTVLRVLERSAEWSMVEYQNWTGYVMNEFLSFAQADGPAVQPPAEEEPDDNIVENLPQEQRMAYVNTASGSLNLRRQPTLNAGVLTTIPQYASITVTAYGDEWCAVRYGTYEGYVMTRYLRFESLPDQKPEKEESSETAPSPEQEKPIPAWVVTASGSLNLRKTASGTAEIQTTIPRHAQVLILEKGTEWCRVSYGDFVGYAMSRFLSTEKPAETEPAKPVKPEQSEPEDEPDEPYITIGGVILDVTLEAPYEALYAETLEELMVYSMCSEDSSALQSIPAGENVEIVLVGDLWCRVAYQNEQGYCQRSKLNVR